MHLSASSGEGFGLPTLQAAAAGAVPLAGAYSASLELVEGHGEAIAIRDWSETEFGIRRALIDVDDAAAQLVRLHDDRGLLRRRSLQSHEFAQAYDWDRVVSSWDDLLGSLGHRRRGPAAPEVVHEERMPALGGTSITVRRVERRFGHLEAAIMADARTRSSDVRLPVVPHACRVAGVLVPRRFGRVCVAPGSELAFLALRRIFPALAGWSPSEAADDDLARYELAESILCLDLDGRLPASLLDEAALYGVPCADGLEQARGLLTDPALAARSVARGDRRPRRAAARGLAGPREAGPGRGAARAWGGGMNLEGYRMYLITVHGGLTDEKSRDLQRFVRHCEGFILMVTRAGPIVALDEGRYSLVAGHPLVELMGPVELNPRGFAAQQLQSIMAENLSKQVEFVEPVGGDPAPMS